MNYRNQSGMTLVEVMVGIAISLFLLLGIGTIMMNNKQSFLAQQNLQRYQENARMASIMITGVTRNAGSHVDPIADEDEAFPSIDIVQGAAGDNNATFPHSLSIVYESAGQLLDCLGATVGSAGPPAAPATVTNTFTVDTANRQLTCSVNGAAAQPLIDNIENMAVKYGVDTNLNNAVDQFLWADEVTAAGQWANVLAVKVVLVSTSDDGVSPVAGSTTYFTQIGVSPGITSATDRRARRELTQTISINSRLHKVD